MAVVAILAGLAIGAVILRYAVAMLADEPGSWGSCFLASAIAVVASAFAVPLILGSFVGPGASLGILLLASVLLALAVMVVIVKLAERGERGDDLTSGASVGVAVLHRLGLVALNLLASVLA